MNNVNEVAAYVAASMEAAARMHKDKGRLEYKAEMHRSAAAFSMAKAMERFGLKADGPTLARLLGMVDNHSAWRQRFEKAGIFPSKDKRGPGAGVDDLLAELAEEGVGE